MCGRHAYHRGHWAKHHHYRKGHKHPARKFIEKFASAWHYPPVNVQELDDRFELFLYAAGYSKEDFQIKLKDNTLIISMEKQKEDVETASNWRRKEYYQTGFQRQFELGEKIDKTAITAKYNNGVLELTLPKLEGFETNRQDILVE